MMTLIQDYGADLLRAIGLHTIYVLISVVIGFAAGLVFGILLSRIPRWLSGIIIPILSTSRPFPAWCSSACCSSGGGISIPR